ncbi:MAG: hypothetical protein FJ387_29885 [Verrucomicrobia bacterium]|nr:hypothetical protein [Verrucomicrobiota bacterium]
MGWAEASMECEERAERERRGGAVETIPAGTLLGWLLEWAEQRDATDVHGQVGKPFTVRIHGELARVPAETCAPLTC